MSEFVVSFARQRADFSRWQTDRAAAAAARSRSSNGEPALVLTRPSHARGLNITRLLAQSQRRLFDARRSRIGTRAGPLARSPARPPAGAMRHNTQNVNSNLQPTKTTTTKQNTVQTRTRASPLEVHRPRASRANRIRLSLDRQTQQLWIAVSLGHWLPAFAAKVSLRESECLRGESGGWDCCELDGPHGNRASFHARLD